MIDVERQYQFDIEVDKTVSVKKQLNVIREDKQSSDSQSDESTSPVVPGVFVSHYVYMCVTLCVVCYAVLLSMSWYVLQFVSQ